VGNKKSFNFYINTMEAKIEAIMKDIENYIYDTNIYDVEKILEKHLQPSKSVEELIYYWT
jgi:hypothetical protein